MRRKLCWHCGKFVCGHCWHHECRCLPNHNKAQCRDLVRFKKYGADWINRLRARQSLPEIKTNQFAGLAAYYRHPATRIQVTE